MRNASAPALTRFAISSPMPFINGIEAAREKFVARTDDDRSEFLRKRGFSKTETAKIIETVLVEEGRKPESVFDFVQGITAVARDKSHQDARLELSASSGAPAKIVCHSESSPSPVKNTPRLSGTEHLERFPN